MSIDFFVLSSSGTSEGDARLRGALEVLGYRSVSPSYGELAPDVQPLEVVRGVALFIDEDASSAETEAWLAEARRRNVPVFAVTDRPVADTAGLGAILPFTGLLRGMVESAVGPRVPPSTAPPVSQHGPPPVVGYPRDYPDSPAQLLKGFVSSETRGYWAAAFIAANVVGLLWEMRLHVLGHDAVQKKDLLAAAAAAESIYSLSIVEAITFVVAIVPFLIWQNRAYKNLWALGNKDLPYSSGRATGGFFIPIANIAISFNSMQAIWQGTSPDTDPQDGEAWRGVRTSPLIWVWSLGIIGARVLERGANSPTNDIEKLSADQTVQALGALFVLTSIASLLLIVAGIAVVAFILLTNRRERARHDRIARDFGDGTPLPARSGAWGLPSVACALVVGAIVWGGSLGLGATKIVWKDVRTESYEVSLPEDFETSQSEAGEERLGATLVGQHSVIQGDSENLTGDGDQAEILRQMTLNMAKEFGTPSGEPNAVKIGSADGWDVAFACKEPPQPKWTQGHLRLTARGMSYIVLVSMGDGSPEFAADRKRFFDSIHWRD